MERHTCVKCGMTEPPTSIDASKNIAWIKCDICFYWYHECCVRGIQLLTNDDEQFICARC